MQKNLIISEKKPLWKSYGGIIIKNSDQTDIDAIVKYITVLKPNESKKIVNAFKSEMFDMGIEYAWNRAMKKLDTRLEVFGLDFISEMVGQESLDSIDSISKKEKIDLAFELGMLDSTAKLKLLHANELINHYMNEEIEEELNNLVALGIINDLTQYILGNDLNVNSIEFISFRNKLTGTTFTPNDNEVELLKSSPYFFVKTTIRTLLNLLNTTEGITKTKVLHNCIIFIEELWDKLFEDDKKHIGNTYAVAINQGDKEIFKTFSTILDKIQGYDYVPETTRSNAYIKVAKNFISTHYEFDNFYNEVAYAKKLNNMGTVIPDFALKECLEAVIISSIGNQYNVSSGAQIYNQKILKKITYEQWKEFFSFLILQNQNVLECIKYSNTKMINNWFNLVEAYVPKDFNIKNSTASNIYKFSLNKNLKVRDESSIALSKIIG